MATSRTYLWQAIRRHAPAWALSLALHVGILGPLCLITWVVATAVRTDPVLTIAPDLAADAGAGKGQDDVAGEEGDRESGIGRPGGAAGAGTDTAAIGPRNDAYSMPRLGAPIGRGEWTSLTGEPGGGLPGYEGNQAGSPFGSGDAAGILIRNLSGKGRGYAGGGGLGGQGDLLVGTGIGFGEEIGKLRGKGLDIVLVLDATDSMSPYIDLAKQRLDDVLNVVTGLVSNTRIGVVAYKDYGDDYGPTAVKGMKITSDANAVRRFLNDIVAGGGGDQPEPINEALKVATDGKLMGWNPDRKRVIVLVGDSTIHPSGRQEAFRLAKAFADQRGTINVIDTGGGDNSQGARRKQVRPDLVRIAKDGGGAAFFLEDDKVFWRHLIVSVFGERFKADVDAILLKYARRE